jgi:DeoR/GlpR family transcriptional regulator of sugar metabolism
MSSLDEVDREHAILSELNETGRVSVNDLARRFGVSTVTVRKDLESLERRSLLRRVRGGGVVIASSDEGSFEMRLRHSGSRKQAIAKSAACEVSHGDVIAIDSSTTAFYLAQEVLDRRNLVVITNSVRLALLFMERSTARVLVPGGVLRRSSGSLVGPIGEMLTSRGRISAGFFGVVGLSPGRGLMDISAEEALTKRSMVQACDRVYALFHSSKETGFGLHSFAETGEITALYTDDGISSEFVNAWQAHNVAVKVAPPLEHVARRGTSVNGRGRVLHNAALLR